MALWLNRRKPHPRQAEAWARHSRPGTTSPKPVWTPSSPSTFAFGPESPETIRSSPFAGPRLDGRHAVRPTRTAEDYPQRTSQYRSPKDRRTTAVSFAESRSSPTPRPPCRPVTQTPKGSTSSSISSNRPRFAVANRQMQLGKLAFGRGHTGEKQDHYRRCPRALPVHSEPRSTCHALVATCKLSLLSTSLRSRSVISRIRPSR